MLTQVGMRLRSVGVCWSCVGVSYRCASESLADIDVRQRPLACGPSIAFAAGVDITFGVSFGVGVGVALGAIFLLLVLAFVVY